MPVYEFPYEDFVLKIEASDEEQASVALSNCKLVNKNSDFAFSISVEEIDSEFHWNLVNPSIVSLVK